jgi:asparagine synthase (glutamine-hydrolysing)
MSGILGVWNSQKNTPWQSMLHDLKVLGTDGIGDWHGLNGKLSLGRTQFFDTPESVQEPPVIEHEGCVAVWDGRLDDRESLMTDSAQCVTDGQLLIESYRRWGIDCIDRMIGEFAFIIWDASNDLLVVGCDPVGRLTVAYAWDGQTLLISSRALTLLQHPQVKADLNPLYLANTLCSLQVQLPGSTPFNGIKRLQPGYVLVLKAGQMTEQQVSPLIFPEKYDNARSADSYYDEFWYLLNKSVKDRLRTIHRPCTTLSGGLDSTTVTVSLLNHLPQIDAFSTVTDIYPEFDEREPIEKFLQMYPQTIWHPVNSDHAWSLSENWDELPIPDDPLISCTLPMNLHLMEQIKQQGFGLIFDGECGDEICAVDLSDLVRAGSWQKLGQCLKKEERLRSVLWWELVLPSLSGYWQQKWFTLRPQNILPEWIVPEYLQSTHTQMAINQNYQAMLMTGLQQNISWALTGGASAASSQVFALMHGAYQLQATSPLQDRRLIEFAMNIPPNLQCDPIHGKIFLRQANLKYLPKQILWRPKDNYFDPMKYMGIAKGTQVLNLLNILKQTPFLENIIDVPCVEKTLLDYRLNYGENIKKSYRNAEANHLYELFTFVNWYERFTHC